MRFTNLPPKIAGLVSNPACRMLVAGCILLLTTSMLRAQTDPFFPEASSSPAPTRPPSRVLPGGQIDRGARSRWRFPKTEEQQPTKVVDVAPVPLVESSASSAVAEEEGDFLPVDFINDAPQTPVYLSEPMGSQDCGYLWPSRHIPNMMGDFFGANRQILTVTGEQLLNATPSDVFDPSTLGTGAQTNFLVVDPGSSVLGRQKPSENNSPWPRDRVYLNYSYLANTSLHERGVGVHRYVPGVERTFNDGMCSWEIRLPVGVTVDSESILSSGASHNQAELGNIYVSTKMLLASSNDFVLAAGLGGNFPTADDLKFQNDNGRELLRVENSAVHLMPYLSAGWIEDDGGWYAQSFLQLDYDLNANPVLVDNGTELVGVGNFRDSAYLYWDISLGYWLIKDRYGACISGIAPVMEIHYNTALNTPEGVRSASGLQLGVNRGQTEVVNLLFGVNFEIASRHGLAIGYGTPIGGGDDEQFDGELRVLLNCNFGGH